MTAIKCAECGLVNFSTAVECKRCKLPLDETSMVIERESVPPIAQSKQFQKTAQQFQPFELPPPPPVFEEDDSASTQLPPPPQNLYCIKCGSQKNVALQNFKKFYTPPIAYLGILIGPLVFLILALILRVKHYLSAPFCGDCWDGYKNLSTISTLLGFICLLLIFCGIAFIFTTSSMVVPLLAIAAGIGIGIYTKVYETKVSPKFKRIDRKQVVINSPIIGDICFDRV